MVDLDQPLKERDPISRSERRIQLLKERDPRSQLNEDHRSQTLHDDRPLTRRRHG
jgi:hypothetical protein